MTSRTQWIFTTLPGPWLDTYVYGFVMQEHALPFGAATGIGVQDVAGDILEQLPADEFPTSLRWSSTTLSSPATPMPAEFEVGLGPHPRRPTPPDLKDPAPVTRSVTTKWLNVHLP